MLLVLQQERPQAVRTVTDAGTKVRATADDEGFYAQPPKRPLTVT